MLSPELLQIIFPPELWFHIAVGFILGILSLFFMIGISNELKKDYSVPNLFKRLVLYSFLVTCISLFYAFAISDGILEQWQLLGYPATDDPAVKIMDVGYVQGKSGNLYYDNEGNWEQVDKVVIDPEKTIVPITTYPPNCGSFPFYPLVRDSFVEIQSTCMVWLGLEKVVYAIDRSGNVYVWSHAVPREFTGIEISLALQGGQLGCVFGVAIIAMLLLSRYVAGKMKKIVTETGTGK